jgi:hypothetical protein
LAALEPSQNRRLRKKNPFSVVNFSRQGRRASPSVNKTIQAMKIRKNSVLPLAAVLFSIVMFVPQEGFAQGNAKADVDKISFDALQSPDINVAKAKNFKPKEWLEVEAKVRLQAAPVPVSGFLDKITVKWYIAAENVGAKATALLTKEVSYVNVPVDEDFFVSVYLSPSAVKRITGSDRASARTVKAVAMQILYNGKEIGTQSSSGPDNWWNNPTLGQMSGVQVLNKNETPFKALWWDRYGEIEEQR